MAIPATDLMPFFEGVTKFSEGFPVYFILEERRRNLEALGVPVSYLEKLPGDPHNPPAGVLCSSHPPADYMVYSPTTYVHELYFHDQVLVRGLRYRIPLFRLESGSAPFHRVLPLEDSLGCQALIYQAHTSDPSNRARVYHAYFPCIMGEVQRGALTMQHALPSAGISLRWTSNGKDLQRIKLLERPKHMNRPDLPLPPLETRPAWIL